MLIRELKREECQKLLEHTGFGRPGCVRDDHPKPMLGSGGGWTTNFSVRIHSVSRSSASRSKLTPGCVTPCFFR